jgi:hypothetical protein
MENGEAVKEKSLVLKDQGLYTRWACSTWGGCGLRNGHFILRTCQVRKWGGRASWLDNIRSPLCPIIWPSDNFTTTRTDSASGVWKAEDEWWFQLQELNERESSGRKRWGMKNCSHESKAWPPGEQESDVWRGFLTWCLFSCPSPDRLAWR